MPNQNGSNGSKQWGVAILPFLAVAIFIVAAFVNCKRDRTPYKRNVRTVLRSVAIAVEAYCVDNKTYPAWGEGDTGPAETQTYNWAVARRTRREGDPATLRTFLMRNEAKPDGRFKTLTTPLSYMTSYPADPFSPIEGATFVYWSVDQLIWRPPDKAVGQETPFGGVGWILISAGPDGDYDIPVDPDVYNPAISQPSERLLTGANSRGSAFTYDSTNGLISDGDIWRVKQ